MLSALVLRSVGLAAFPPPTRQSTSPPVFPTPPPSPGATSNVAGVSNAELLAASAGSVALPQDDGSDSPASAAADPTFGLPVDMSALNSSAESLLLLGGGGLTLDSRPFFRCDLLCSPRHRSSLGLKL